MAVVPDPNGAASQHTGREPPLPPPWLWRAGPLSPSHPPAPVWGRAAADPRRPAARVFRRGDNTPSRVWGREQGGVVSGSPTRSRAVASGAPRHWRRHGQTARSAPAWAGLSPHNPVWGAGVGGRAPRSRRRDGWGPLPAKRPDPPVRADEGGADAPPGSCISATHPSARRNPPCRAVRGLPRPRARPSGARYSTVVREAPTTLTWRPGEGERGGARRKSRRRPPQRRVV